MEDMLEKELHVAIQKHDLERVQELIQKGADVNFLNQELKPPRSPLYLALSNQQNKIAVALVQAGAKYMVSFCFFVIFSERNGILRDSKCCG
jgi:hypothetical protein